MKKFIPSLVATSLILAGCNATQPIQQSAVKAESRQDNQFLSMQDAMKRSARVSNVDYELNFNLTGDARFSASSFVRFDLADTQTDLTLDLDKANIELLTVNGKTIEKPNYNKAFITIDAADLVVGENTVLVKFSRDHSTNGEGLHRFTDPVDGKVYLYSHFEPAAAHQMFAGFDQPDLKANYQLTVTAPKDWQVISSMKETSIVEHENSNTWYFDRTLKLSPYNFSMHAGPYHQWQDNSGKYPMRLFVRQSVAKQVNPKDWFTYTKQGIKFFENYYGIDYPFRKYDQVLVPDFLYGAMENAAAITFAERGFLTNGEMTDSQRNRLASVILHEMAHQWFGNLVTMKWWNGLWLNESFAAFMQTMATASATEFKNEWRSFYAGGKQAAYRQDQLVTTHPIEVPVPSTANAFDNIDAITYSKGASVLNQLRHLLGEAVFRRGIHNYLSQNAYQNAKLDDFIKALADASGKNLDTWKQQWLYQAGVNTIEAKFSCIDGKINQFQLHQSADAKFPTLREQRVQLGLFNIDQGKLQLTSKQAVTYNGATTEVASLIGRQCPDLVYPNYQDWGFVKVNLDEKSFNTAKLQMSKVDDALLRSMLWQSLYDSMRDAKITVSDYLATAIDNITHEDDYTILGQAVRQISSATRYLTTILGADHPDVIAMNKKLAKLAWQQTNQLSAEKSKQRRWFGFFQNFAKDAASLAKLQDLLAGKITIKGLTISQDLRWGIIVTLNQANVDNAAQLVQAELERDGSDTGEKSALAANVVRPDANAKKRYLDMLLADDTKLPFSKLRTIMFSLYPNEQHQLAEQTAKLRLDTLAKMDQTKGAVFMRSYARSLIPTGCDLNSVERLQKYIDSGVKLSTGTKRALLVAHQEDQRCLMIKNKQLQN